MDLDSEVFDFGRRLRHLREKAQLTQDQLADKAGISRSSLYRYESSQHIPDGEVIKKLAMTLHTSSDYLLGISNTPIIAIHNLTSEQEKLIYGFISEFIDRKNR